MGGTNEEGRFLDAHKSGSDRQWSWAILAATLVASLLVFAPPAPASAATVEVDLTFGGMGFVWPDIGEGGRATGQSVAIDNDGKIIAAGTCSTRTGSNFCVARYNSDGTLDNSFGDGGSVSTNIAGTDHGNAVVIDPTGKIVVAGVCSNSNSSSYFCLVRYTISGELDFTFGDNGIAANDIGRDAKGDDARSLIIDERSNIVVAGTCRSALSWTLCLARYTPTGELDTTFGDGGSVRTEIGDADLADSAESVAIDGSGSIVVTGQCSRVFAEICVVRYTSDGTLDSTFGGDGIVTVDVLSRDDRGSSVAIDADQNIVVAGFCEDDTDANFCVLRLTPTGDLDTTFSGDGVVTTDFGPDSHDVGRALAIGGDGKIVVTGTCGVDLIEMCMARYSPTGVLDTTFDGDGIITTDVGNDQQDDHAEAIAIDANGNIIVVDYCNAGQGFRFCVVRYTVGSTVIPGAPRDVIAIPGDRESAAAWSAPAFDGGSPVTGYTVTASPGGQTCVTASLACTVAGLTNWVNYRFSVTATNVVGTGPASALSSVTVPGTSPGKPAGVSAAAGGVVSWSVPSGGEVIDRHVVEYREVGTPSPWLTASTQTRDGSLDLLIVGGDNVDIANHGYGVKLLAFDGDNGVIECGGTLIAPRWVLTAAHCTEFVAANGSISSAESIAIVYGLSDWTTAEEAGVDSHVTYSSAIEQHPGWDRSAVVNDIALVQLDVAVDMANADTLPLFDLAGPADATPAFVTGWGLTATNGSPSDILQGTDVAIDSSCGLWPRLDPHWDPSKYLCASGYPSGFCQGDSGGPLVVENGGVVFLAGIVSFSSSLGCVDDPALPDVYTRVSTYVDWIEGHTGALWASQTVSGAGQLSTTIPGIGSGTSYVVRIHAENSFGASDAVLGSFVPSPAPIVLGTTETRLDCSVSQSHPFTVPPLAEIPQLCSPKFLTSAACGL